MICIDGNSDDFSTDVDECNVPEMESCDPNADCTNSIGSFDCRCRPGYEGDGQNCTGITAMCLFIITSRDTRPGDYFLQMLTNVTCLR